MTTINRSIARLATVALLALAAIGCGDGLREDLTEFCVTSENQSQEICGHIAECMLSRASDHGISRGDVSEALQSDSWDHKPELDEYAWNDDIRRCVAARQRSNSEDDPWSRRTRTCTSGPCTRTCTSART